MCVRECVCVCVRVCVRACVRACVYVMSGYGCEGLCVYVLCVTSVYECTCVCLVLCALTYGDILTRYTPVLSVKSELS